MHRVSAFTMAACSTFGSNDDQLEDELRCAVCLEYFNTPVLLPCTHTFCKTCVSDIIRINAQSDRAVPRALRCPTCRERVTLSAGLDTLPVNRNLDNLVRLFKSRKPIGINGLFPSQVWGKQKPSIETQRDCSQHDRPLALSCSTCKIILCRECAETHNVRFPTHIVRALEELCHEQEVRFPWFILTPYCSHRHSSQQVSFVSISGGVLSCLCPLLAFGSESKDIHSKIG